MRIDKYIHNSNATSHVSQNLSQKLVNVQTKCGRIAHVCEASLPCHYGHHNISKLMGWTTGAGHGWTKTIHMPPHPPSPSLAFIKAVISEVVGKPLRGAHYAFVAAITAFWDLPEFLQRKEQSHAFIVAAIEMHAVNHASGLWFDQGIVDSKLLTSVSELRDDT